MRPVSRLVPGQNLSSAGEGGSAVEFWVRASTKWPTKCGWEQPQPKCPRRNWELDSLGEVHGGVFLQGTHLYLQVYVHPLLEPLPR